MQTWMKKVYFGICCSLEKMADLYDVNVWAAVCREASNPIDCRRCFFANIPIFSALLSTTAYTTFISKECTNMARSSPPIVELVVKGIRLFIWNVLRYRTL